MRSSRKSSKSSSLPVLLVAFGVVIVIAAGAYLLLGDDPTGPLDGDAVTTEAELTAPVMGGLDEIDVPTGERLSLTADPEVTSATGATEVALVDPDSPTGRIEGRCVDQDDRPVEGALIRISSGSPIANMTISSVREFLPMQATSAPDGRFALEDVPEGKNYLIVAEHIEYAPALVQGQRVRSDETLADVRLVLRPGALIQGVVLTQAESPIPEARVEVYDSVADARLDPADRKPARIVFTDAAGRFAFPNISYTSYQLRVSAMGFETQSIMRSSALTAGPSDADLRFLLAEGRVLAGTVLDEKGKAVEGARIEATALKKDYQGSAFAYSDRTGDFLLEGMSTDHSYQVRCTAVGYSDKVLPSVHVDDGDVLFELDSRLSVEGVVTSSDGTALSKFNVVLMRAVPGREPVLQNDLRPFSDPEGRFVFDDLEPGRWAFEARHPEFAPTRSDVVELTRDGGAPPLVEIRMTRGGTLKGLVRNADGEPVEGALVQINPNEFIDSPILKIFDSMSPSVGRNLSMRTNDSGRFQFKHITPGVYQVAVSHHQHAPYTQNDVQVIDDDAGSNPEVMIQMPAPAIISGMAYDQNRRSLSHVRVQLSRGNGYVESVTTDSDGRFRFDNLTEGDYMITLFPDTKDGQPINPLLKLVYAQKSKKELTLRAGEQRTGVEMYLSETS